MTSSDVLLLTLITKGRRHLGQGCYDIRGVFTNMQKLTEALLQEIEDYCQRIGIAESTYGRYAINDGELCAR